MINKKRAIMRCFIITSVLVMMGLVNSFGIGIPYSIEDPLMLYPGQSSDITVDLQSSADEGDLIIVPEISEGQEIAEITDGSKEYKVISNQPVGAAIHLKISIPDDAVIGKEYPVTFLFKDVTPKTEGGMVGLSTSIRASFNVLVVAGNLTEVKTFEPIRINEVALIIMLAIPIIFVIAIIIISLMIRRKR